ncbi:TonB-dependent receptor, partial [Ochrovirga pacifica]|uniref:TonB-dependent receptor n=1 Tax=Ochrovirga pacifica TaxID=1042376 RepID=UPI0002559200
MRNLLFTLFALMTAVVFAQSKGTVSGMVQDKEMNLEPLPFVSIYVQGNPTIGTTTDFDGVYQLNLKPGNYTLVYEFQGYKKETKAVTVKAKGKQTVNVVMQSQADALDAVVLNVVTNKESEAALLAVQKEKVEIIESIGAEQLSKAGVSDAASATAKISGVQKNEASGDVYIRGLGDRYLFTTMNGLPIPSDDIEKKNINLNLFPTSIIQNVGISKTYSTSSYADQSSGHVDITSKEYSKNAKGIKIGVGTGINSNVVGVFGEFKATQNINNVTFGYHNSDLNPGQALFSQSWNTASQSLPIDYSLSLAGGYKFEVNDNHDLMAIISLSHSRSYDYYEGMFAQYRGNSLNNDFPFVEEFNTSINTTGLIDLKYDFGKDHSIKLTNLYINKLSDNVYEQGGDGFGFVFDQQPVEYGAFVRDQNTKQTQILVNQLLGSHTFDDRNKFNWAAGINNVQADEPNRIRNEVNFGTAANNVAFGSRVLNDGVVKYAYVGGFQQRKSSQEIEDFEYNALLNFEHVLVEKEGKRIRFNIGGNYRNRTRDFRSKFDGLIVTTDGNDNNFSVSDINNLTEGLTQENINRGYLRYNNQNPDTYKAELDIIAGYLNTDMKFGVLTVGLGVRYEQDVIDMVEWNVNNYFLEDENGDEITSLSNTYDNILPSFNMKYELNDQHSLRLAGSKTITLPEFKELAPFNYVSPTGRVTRGNPELIASTNYNVDFKWEFFPTKEELISATVFYKLIQDPINRSLTRGSSGYFTYSNTGDKANVYGIELEGKKEVYETETFGKLD